MSTCEECARLTRRIVELEKEVAGLTSCPEIEAVRVSGNVSVLHEEPDVVVKNAADGSNCVAVCLVSERSFAVSGADSSLSLYNGDTSLVARVRLESPATSLRSGGGREGWLAATTMDGSVRVFSPRDLSLLSKAKDHSKIAVDCDWSPSQKLLATCARDQTVALYSLDDRGDVQLRKTLHLPNNAECLRFLDDSRLIVSCRNEPFLRIVDAETFAESRSSLNQSAWDTHNSFDVLHMSLNDNFSLAALATSQSRHLVCDPRRRQGIARVLTGHESDPYSNTRIAWLADDSIVSSSSDTSLHQWDFGTGKRIFTIPRAHDRPVRNLDAHRSSGLLVTASFDKTAKLWTTTTPRA